MVRRKTTLRSKSGGYAAQNGNGNGNPRALVDEAVYREFQNFSNWQASAVKKGRPFWDPQYSGWSNASRPRDYPIYPRTVFPVDAG